MFDTEKLAERKMEELRIKGQIGKVVKSYELKEIFLIGATDDIHSISKARRRNATGFSDILGCTRVWR